jgi:hypothetical protein
MSRNYGPGVSRYLDPTGRNWELPVFQAGKPLTDAEITLSAELTGQVVRNPSAISGWSARDALGGMQTGFSHHVPYVVGVNAPNMVVFSPMKAVVNGWTIQVHSTLGFTQSFGNSTNNRVTLGTGPAGAGAIRTDLVVLEVWRRLISASPSTVGKSPSGRIWKDGNVKLFDPNDATFDTNFNSYDDLLDTNVGSETTKRVQVQYRLRVIQGVDIHSYPFGLDDTSLVAHSVPASATAPDGVATTFAYNRMDAPSAFGDNGDPGCWVAGDGNPTNALGTVDGYLYAIPLCAVFRRNATAFDRISNQNGGVAYPGPSDRPDGTFYDLIIKDDIADLRRMVNLSGSWDYNEVLDKQMNLLLDNNLRSEWAITPYGGGNQGHTLFRCDEIGVSNANGGIPPINGSTAAGPLINEFDTVRRYFSDRPVLEIAPIRIHPSVPWVAGATFILDPAALEIYPYTPYDWAAHAPDEVTFTEVLNARFIGADGAHVSAPATLARITGLGAQPVGVLTVKMGTIPAGVTNEDLFLDLVVAYPAGRGLSATPVEWYSGAGYAVSPTVTINNPAQLPATAPVSYAVLTLDVDAPHREAHLRYTTVPLTLTVSADNAGASTTVHLPERANTITAVVINATPAAGWSLSVDGRSFTISPATAPGDVVHITYTALRPLPANHEQVGIWYRSRAPQTVRDGILPTPIWITPRAVGKSLHTITAGSGSLDEAYPFPFAYVQAGAVKTATADPVFTGDHELRSGGHVSIGDFDADTGWLKLPTFVDMVAPADWMNFQRVGPAATDIEGRTYYDIPPLGETGPFGYAPNAYAQNFSEPKRHKVVLPVLCETSTQTSAWATSNQLVLMLLSRWAHFDEINGVWFDENTTTNTTCASFYRLRGGLLSGRV